MRLVRKKGLLSIISETRIKTTTYIDVIDVIDV